MEIKKKTKTLIIRIVLLSLYMVAGAGIFSVIEGNDSDRQKFEARAEELRQNMSSTLNASLELVDFYTKEIQQLFRLANRCKYSHNDWSYYQSLYFVASVTTTIGYGHLAPRTQAGRLFLIFFALVGIPLNLLTLQSVGEHVYTGLLFLIRRTEEAVLKRHAHHRMHLKSFLTSIALFILMLPIGGVMYYNSERENEAGWTFLDSVYYCFVALTTIGFGDLVPNEGREPDSTYEKGMWAVRLIYLGLGLSLLSGIFASVVNASREIQGLLPWKKERYRVSVKAVRGSKIPKLANTPEQFCHL